MGVNINILYRYWWKNLDFEEETEQHSLKQSNNLERPKPECLKQLKVQIEQ